MNELSQAVQKRVLWADALRSLCCLMVVLIHVCGTDWYALPANESAWLLSNAVDSLICPSVVIFFMLSGSFLLQKDPDGRSLLRKALRLAVLWLVMSVFYVLVSNGIAVLSAPIWFLSQVFKGHFHLWFLRTMVCLYLILPVLRALVAYQDGKWVKWFLGVFFIFGVVRQSLGQLPVSGEMWNNFRLVFVPELCEYSGYFVLGWYLTQKTAVPQGKQRRLCVLVYLLAAAVIAVGTYLYSVNVEVNDERLYAYMGLPTLVMAVCLFQFARGWKETKLLRLAARFAPLTLGVYVFHPFMIDVAKHLGISPGWPRVWFIPAATVCAFLLSAAVTWCLRRIPVVKKFL